MIFGKDLGRSAFFAEVGSEVERLDNIPSDYKNLVCIGQGISLTDPVGREYRIDLFISPTGRVAVRLPLPLAGASPAGADPKHLRRVASIVRVWSVEQLNEVCADHFYRTEGQAADIIDVLVRAGRASFSDAGKVGKALASTLTSGELLFEVADSASAHKSFTSRELIDRFSAAKGVDPDDVTEFIGALEVMDGFSAVSIGREIIVQYAPLGDGRPYQLFKFTIGQHRSDVVAEPRVTRHQLQSNGRDPAEADSFFEALIPYADTASMKPAPDGSVSILPLSIDAMMDSTMGLVSAARDFAKSVSK